MLKAYLHLKKLSKILSFNKTFWGKTFRKFLIPKVYVKISIFGNFSDENFVLGVFK